MTFSHSQKGVFKKYGSKHFSGGSGPPSSLHSQLWHESVPLQSEKRSYGPVHEATGSEHEDCHGTAKKLVRNFEYWKYNDFKKLSVATVPDS